MNGQLSIRVSAIASVLTVLGCLSVLQGCSGGETGGAARTAGKATVADSSPVRGTLAPATSAETHGGPTPAAVVIEPPPQFGRREEADRYFDAMRAGDERALQVAEQALEQAKAAGNAEPAFLAELSAERERRKARLAAFETARRDQKLIEPRNP